MLFRKINRVNRPTNGTFRTAAPSVPVPDTRLGDLAESSPKLDSPAWEQVRDRFRQIWGYADFRSPQGEIVAGLLAHHDTLTVMPTGAGKSVCFQLPALMSQGLTLVVSPLVALMENQVQDLQRKHLPAALLHSEMPAHQRKQTLRSLQQHQLRLLYLSPETLLSTQVWNILCDPTLIINGLMVDEAHCLVQWGTTFRPVYRRLGTVRPALAQTNPPGHPMAIAAFTATADPQTQQMIREVLDLRSPQVFSLSPYRPNLHLSVKIAWSPQDRRQRLRQFIQAHPDQSGLVYVRTRRDSEALADWLTQQGIATAAYHAGLGATVRRPIEQAWLSDRLQCVICTSAFGMGIDKPDVRWIVHVHPPALLSEYVQEIGRAGRDGDPSEALLLVSEPTGWLDSSDRQRQRYFEQQGRSQYQTAQRFLKTLPETGDVNTVARSHRDGAIALAILHSTGQLTWTDPFHYRLHPQASIQAPPEVFGSKQVQRYQQTRHCRWAFLLQQFGVPDSSDFRCGRCDRCQS